MRGALDGAVQNLGYKPGAIMFRGTGRLFRRCASALAQKREAGVVTAFLESNSGSAGHSQALSAVPALSDLHAPLGAQTAFAVAREPSVLASASPHKASGSIALFTCH